MRKNEGFTLIEMMIAIGIATMLVGGIYGALVSTQRTAGMLAEDEVKDSARSRAVELLRGDFRARGSLKVEAGAEDWCTLTLSSTSDALSLGALRRSVAEIHYAASPKGLSRAEGKGSGVDLATGPVVVEFWDRGAWRKQSGDAPLAVRVTFSEPSERVVLR